MPRIENGFWLTLTDEMRGRSLYQASTDVLTDAEFLELWQNAGKIILRQLRDANGKGPINGAFEFRIRANQLP